MVIFSLAVNAGTTTLRKSSAVRDAAITSSETLSKDAHQRVIATRKRTRQVPCASSAIHIFGKRPNAVVLPRRSPMPGTPFALQRSCLLSYLLKRSIQRPRTGLARTSLFVNIASPPSSKATAATRRARTVNQSFFKGLSHLHRSAHESTSAWKQATIHTSLLSSDSTFPANSTLSPRSLHKKKAPSSLQASTSPPIRPLPPQKRSPRLRCILASPFTRCFADWPQPTSKGM